MKPNLPALIVLAILAVSSVWRGCMEREMLKANQETAFMALYVAGQLMDDNDRLVHNGVKSKAWQARAEAFINAQPGRARAWRAWQKQERGE